MNTTKIFVVAAIIAAALMIGQTAVMVQQAAASGVTVTNGGTVGGRCDDCAGNIQNQQNTQNSFRHR
jgi:hypothetical protein